MTTKDKATTKVITVYTDGGCNPNPGPGAYAAIIPIDGTDDHITLTKGYKLTTNNRMELMGLIVALEEFGPNKTFDVYIDSQYVINGCKFWVHAWARKGWKNTDWKTGMPKPIKNLDLWQRLYPLLKENKITYTWVKGHSGNKYNELADEACTKSLKDPTATDEGYVANAS